jgi:PEGA domain
MALPFKLDPESPKRTAEDDPFLEFESERPGMRLSLPARETQLHPETDEPADADSERPHAEGPVRSAINPVAAFAFGVAGLVSAGVSYFQLGQFLANRPAPAATTTSSTTTPGSPAEPPATVTAPVGTARVDVASNPPGAIVSLDGSARGVTPIVLSGLIAGTHEIVISRGGVSVSRTVELANGEARAVSAHLPTGERSTSNGASRPESPAPPTRSAPAASSWMSVDSPIELQVFEDGRLLGSTGDGRVAVPPGIHDFTLVNTLLEYRQALSLTTEAGRTATGSVSLPTGLLSVNALPWAEVWIDGNSAGTTPLAHLTLTIGSHEVVWRHPTLGDRRQTVVVKARTPARAGVDFTRDR